MDQHHESSPEDRDPQRSSERWSNVERRHRSDWLAAFERGNPINGSTSETAIVGAITIAALYMGQSLLIPLALSLFLTFLLAPVVYTLRKWHAPKGLAVSLVALVAFSILMLFGFLVGRQITSFAEDLPRYQSTLIYKIKAIKVFATSGTQLEKASETIKTLRKEIEESPSPGPEAPATAPQRQPAPEPTPRPLPVIIESQSTPLDQLKQTISVVAPPLVTAGIVILFVVILLLYNEDVRDRAIRVLGVHDLERTTRAMDDAGRRLNRYFLASTTINAAFGIVIGLGLWWIGVPNPILWGVLSMLMRFVPFIGVPLAAVLPVFLSVVVDPGWMMLAETVGLFVLSELVVSQVVETFVHGEATGLSPLAVILAAAFWALLWGPVGLVLAVPMTVMLVVLGHHIERFSLFEVLLGAEPALSPADGFYQRILADDPEEAVSQAEVQLKDMTLADYYDSVVMDALKKAMRDAQAGRLDLVRLRHIKSALQVFIETMADVELQHTALDQKKSEPDDGKGVLLQDRTPAPAILCVAAKSELDEAAAAMLAQLLETRGLHARVASPLELNMMAGNVVSKTQIVCLSAFDVGERSAQARFLVKRLRRQMPTAHFLGAFWRLDKENPAHKTIIESIETDDVVSTLSAAIDRCILQSRGATLRSDSPAPYAHPQVDSNLLQQAP